METIDGSAVEGEDYEPVNEILTFEPREREKEVKSIFLLNYCIQYLIRDIRKTIKIYYKSSNILGCCKFLPVNKSISESLYLKLTQQIILANLIKKDVQNFEITQFEI